MDIFDYDNVLLLPRKCRVESRAECDASTEFGGRRFKLPAVPANMKTVVDEKITEWLAANGYFYVMHRFDLDNVAYAQRMRDKGLFVSISSGVKQADRDVVDRLAADGVGARKSATKSAIVKSVSCPTPQTTGKALLAMA